MHRLGQVARDAIGNPVFIHLSQRGAVKSGAVWQLSKSTSVLLKQCCKSMPGQASITIKVAVTPLQQFRG